MEYRILGPLEIRSSRGVLQLPRRRERALLTALLLHANEVVSTDRLIEALWGENPPRTAVGSLQNAVSSLRKGLDDDALRTQPPGYLLAVDPDDVDATRFERMVRKASGLDPPDRAEALAQALALWRGPALGDVADETFAATEAARLDELRLVAVEERSGADLDLGRDAELIPELEAHVSAHPLRERARGQLMLALYRAGRQAEALEAYQETRRALVDELGIDPSQELQDLERRILRQDPALSRAALPSTAEHPTRPDIAEVRKTVTVLAAALDGAEGLDPERLRSVLDLWLEALRTAVDRHGGLLDRHIGTEAVAVFGAPAAHEDDALRAARAAVDLRELLAGDELAARVGISTGEALVGAGTAAVVGDVVSSAMRLREAADPGVTLVADSTLGLVRDAVTISAAGIAGASRLDAARGAHGRERRLDLPLAGRDEELSGLRESLARVTAERRCEAVVVIGEAGIGKTRLARELATTLTRARVLTGRCVPYGEGTAYVPVLEILGEVGDEEVAALIEGDAPAPRGEVFYAVRTLLASLARADPVVVVLDDLHWAEHVLLDLVEYLTERITAAVLVVGLARPELLESRPEWAGGVPQLHLLRLGPLDADDARSALEALGDLEPAARETVLARAAGNPLHLEQLHAFVAEEGHDAEDVPETVDAVLSHRLDRLDAADLDLLRRASVLGEHVTRGGVAALAADGSAVDATLLGLVRRSLLHPEDADGDDGYAFHHALLRDVAYGGLTKGVRADLHQRAAHWYDRDGDGLDEVVGFHLERSYWYGSELGHASEELAATAGDRLARAAWREARAANAATTIDLYGRALALVPAQSPQRAELEWELAIALRLADRWTEGQVWLAQSLETARRHDLAAIEARGLVEVEREKLYQGESTPDDVVRVIDAALPVLREARDDRGLARALITLQAPAFFRGRYAEGMEAGEQAALHYRAIRYSPAASVTAIGAALVFGATPTDEAITRCETLRVDADHASEAAILSSLAVLHGFRGEFEIADSYGAQSVELWAMLGMGRSEETTALERAMHLARLRGSRDEVVEIARRRLAVYEIGGGSAWLSTAAAQLAWVLLDRDDTDEAADHVTRAASAAHPHDVLVQSLAATLRGRLLARAGDAAGLDHGEAGVAALEGSDGLPDLATAWAGRAEIELLLGRHAESATSVERARQYCDEKRAPALWAYISRLLDRA